MGVVVVGAFLGVALVLSVLVGLAVLGVVHFEMSGSAGVGRDGLNRGVAAPRWSIADSTGRSMVSPPAKPFQLIVFTDHSLRSFPSVVDGLRDLRYETDLESVIMLRGTNQRSEDVLRLLGLGGIPVVAGSASLYGRYNVRVMPWIIFVDSSGFVRASSLVNHERQIKSLWRLARAPITSPAQRDLGRRWRLKRGLGGVRA